MIEIIKTEFQKMKRYNILLIGIIGMSCSPLLQLFSQKVVTEENKIANFDIAALLESTIWGNATIFMPIIITLIGGYLINREYTDDTLKNILTVPISFQKFLIGKLSAIGLLSVILGIYCFIITTVVGMFSGLSYSGNLVLIKQLFQMIGLSICIYIAVLPIISICSKRTGAFMGGSIIAFILGYCCMFFKSGLLRNIYPVSAALTIIGFDTSSYSGTINKGSIPLGITSLSIMLLISIFVICHSKVPGRTKKYNQLQNKKVFVHFLRRKNNRNN